MHICRLRIPDAALHFSAAENEVSFRLSRRLPVSLGLLFLRYLLLQLLRTDPDLRFYPCSRNRTHRKCIHLHVWSDACHIRWFLPGRYRRKLYRIIPEMESIDSVYHSLLHAKKDFTVISLDTGNQIIFSVQFNSTGVHDCIDSKTFHGNWGLSSGLRSYLQVSRCNMFSCQYRIFITVINTIVKIRFLHFFWQAVFPAFAFST